MEYTFHHVGDHGLAVEFASEISLPTNRKVCALKLALERQAICGIQELIPTYRSLLILYDPLRISWTAIRTAVTACADNLENIPAVKAMVTEIPVLYQDEYAMDLEDIAKIENKTVEEIIRIHSGSDYYVYMLGFSPGHPYTARFENPFSFQRRSSPRVRIPGGCVVVQREQSNITPFAQPCGWNVIGATPLLMCDYRHENPFLLQAGQWVRYVPIDRAEFLQIKRQVELDCYVCKTYEKEVSYGDHHG
jgi:KipI family sensor histidine kinase inhibitor